MKKIVLILTIILSSFFIAGFSLPAFAENDACNYIASDALCKNKDDTNPVQRAKNIINILLTIVGAGSVVVIIYAGILFVISSGNSQTIQTAKNTIIYAVIGLVISILSFAIVNFVVSSTATP